MPTVVQAIAGETRVLFRQRIIDTFASTFEAIPTYWMDLYLNPSPLDISEI